MVIICETISALLQVLELLHTQGLEPNTTAHYTLAVPHGRPSTVTITAALTDTQRAAILATVATIAGAAIEPRERTV